MDFSTKMKVIIVAIIFTLLTENHAQIPSEDCPDVTVVQNFNVSEYLGRWYEQQKYPFIFGIGGKCISAEYSSNPDGTVKVVNQQINELTGNPSSLEGVARLNSTTGEAKLFVSFPKSTNNGSPYWVLATDYVRYSVVWACSESFGVKSRTSWILTRERNPSEAIINEALSIFKNQNIPTDPLMKTNQENCSQ